MVRVRLFHVTSKEMGTGHRCDRGTHAFAESHLEIRVYVTCHGFTHIFDNFKLTALFIFS